MVGPLGFALVAMLATLGILIVVAGMKGALPRFETVTTAQVSTQSMRMLLAVFGFAVSLFLTRWPVAALYLGFACYAIPGMIVARRRRRASVARVEAIAVWAEGLRDTMAASAGIQDALRSTARVAPEPIKTEVRDLALRLQHESVVSALRRFAADLRNPLSDLVVATLILATARHAGSLQGVLATTAQMARDLASMTRHVEATRARIYTQVQFAAWVTAFLIVLFISLRRDFLIPYDSILGQIVMIFIGGAFAGAGYAIYRLGRPVEQRRFFSGVETWSADLPTATPATGSRP